MNFNDIINQITHPEDVTGQFYPQDITANQASGVIASIPLLFWVPLVLAKDSPYAKFCANQGLALTVLFAVMIAVKIFVGWIPLLGWLLSLVCSLIVLSAFVLLLISACQGKARKIPIIGNMIQVF